MKKPDKKNRPAAGLTRRDFLKTAGAVLPSIAVLGLGSIAAASGPLAAAGQGGRTTVPDAGAAGDRTPLRNCNWGCAGACSGSCGGTCSYGCDNTCRGSCYQTCTGSCQQTCRGSCSNNCGSGCSGTCTRGCSGLMR